MRPWQTWLALAVCLALGFSALAWLTRTGLELDRAQELARQQALVEESARLALWRMESTAAQLVAQESALPAAAYQPFVSLRPQGPSGKAARAVEEAVVASPLLRLPAGTVVVHFQLDESGRLTSPQLPVGTDRQRAAPLLSSHELARAQKRLDRAAQLVSYRQLAARLPAAAEPSDPVVVAAAPAQQPAQQPIQQTGQQAAEQAGQQLELAQVAQQQQVRSNSEFRARQQYVVQNTVNYSLNELNNRLLALPDMQPAVMTPLWIDGQLVLARRGRAGGQSCVQGCLLDWPALKGQLLASIADLLPRAELRPVEGSPAEDTRRLASLPLQLAPGELTAAPTGPSALKLALGLAWGCMFLAGVAVAVLLRGVLVFSERRAAFVSAVSHELRTPLTTFRMYSEMLCDGMVSDDARRQGYLETLRAEADRLTHLVENVLAYSRLERGRPARRAAALSVGELLNDGTSQRLAQRAAQAGFDLNVSCDDALLGERVVADRMAVEQILFNLVDNACKYAASADDRRLDLAVARQTGRVLFSLRDRGPGVAPRERRRLFRPFHKSAGDAANSAPGVGLGLALSRRLARDLGGRLDLAAGGGPGACFVLALPLASQP